MRIVQISDTHISFSRPSRASDLEACIRHINAIDPQPDVVVHTGDVAHDGSAEEYDIARRRLERLAAPYFVIPGNRDSRGELIKSFADGKRIHIGMDFVQYAVDDFAARMIFIDTLSTASNKGRLCETRLEQIDAMLAADRSRPAMLFMHHPPFQVPVGPDPVHFESWGEVDALMARLGRYDHIRGIFCGHVHRNFEATIGAVPASIVSCVAVDLQKGKKDASTPDQPMLKSFCFP
jgi:3',5'-cyclic AMP phosphodiesterase CpdA